VQKVLIDILSKVLDECDEQIHDHASHVSKTFDLKVAKQFFNYLLLVHDQQWERIAMLFQVFEDPTVLNRFVVEFLYSE
jgi:hypothetical protein